MKEKLPLVILVCTTLFVGVAFGAFIVVNYWETQMTMELAGTEDYSIRLIYPNGTAISSYNWGKFGIGETKSLFCYLQNNGSVTYNYTWNATIPTGWDVTISTNYTTPEAIWMMNQNWGPMPPGVPLGMPTFINVTESGASLGASYNFAVRFYSGADIG